MDILTDLTTGQIVQVTDRGNGAVKVNGKFVPAIPDIAPVSVDGSSYVVPVDGGDVTSRAFVNMLTQFPMYGHALFNPLLTAADVAALDLTASFGSDPTRAAVGRAVGPLPVGQSPNRTRVLRRNPVTLSPGVLVTDTIDVSAIVPGGIDEVLVWWKLEGLSRTQDVSSSYGATAGQDDPCLVSLLPQVPEPAGFDVYASSDDGVTWYPAGYLTPTDLVNLGTLVRLAFVNNGSQDRRLSGFGLLF
jgi:hypothetical protein